MKPLIGNGANVSGKFERKFIFLMVPLFVSAVLLGFFLELITVERMGLREVSLVISHHVPKQMSLLTNLRFFQIKKPSSSENEGQSDSSSMSEENLPIDTHPFSRPLPKVWEKASLLNLSNFQWIRNNDSICELNGGTSLRILPVLVHTARSHFSERITIRKSWGSVRTYKNWSVRLVFLLGEADRGAKPTQNEIQLQEQEAKLDQEHLKYGDLVTGSFTDTYKNLTYKHMMGYKWILNFCQNAAFVLKVDDDMFIDILRFLSWRTDDLDMKMNTSSSSEIPELYCNTFVGTKPQRCVGCKWYASETEWTQDFYPDYCSGWAYGITVDLIRKLYESSTRVNFFWVDDVYATGVLMEQAKIDYNNHLNLNVRHLWGQVRGLDFRNFRPMCEKGDLTMKRKFGAVVPIARGSNFERDMICLWNKTLYDDEAEAHSVS